MTTRPLEHVADLIELDFELRETVVATFVWDGTSEVRVEADDEEDVEELSLVVRRGIPAVAEPPRLVTGRDGLAFLLPGGQHPGVVQPLMRAHAAGGFPQTLLLDPEGREVLRFRGFHPPDAYLEELEEIGKAEVRLGERPASQD